MGHASNFGTEQTTNKTNLMSANARLFKQVEL